MEVQILSNDTPTTWESTLDGGYDGIRDGSIPSFGNGGSTPPSPYLEVWQSQVYRRILLRFRVK